MTGKSWSTILAVLARNSAGTWHGLHMPTSTLASNIIDNIRLIPKHQVHLWPPSTRMKKIHVVVSKGHTSHFRAGTKFNSKTNLAGGDGCLENHLLARGSALVSMANKRRACTITADFYEAQNEMQLRSAIVAKNSLTHGEKIPLNNDAGAVGRYVQISNTHRWMAW